MFPAGRDYNQDNLYLNYDLRTNLIYDQVEVESLQKLCILTAVVHAFKDNEAIEEIDRIFYGNGTRNIFTLVEDIVQREKRCPHLFVKEMKLTIRLVYKQIERFLECVPWIYKFIFVRNVYFNWQGAINPRETALKILESGVFTDQKSEFEFSCKYLFDEDVISRYFNDLQLVAQDYYLKPQNFYDFDGQIFFHWIWRIRTKKPISGLGIISYCFFLRYTQSFSNCGIGVQYFFENLTLPNSIICQAILNLLNVRVPMFHKFNISMYLICQIRDNGIVNVCSYGILINLIKNPRWHNIFMKYFKALKHAVSYVIYMDFVNIVKREVELMMEIEGENGYYFDILKEFIIELPFMGKREMKTYYMFRYAKLVFHLFAYGDTEILESILTISPNVPVIVRRDFYTLVIRYFYLFKAVYKTQYETFLRNVIREDRISDLLRSLS